MNECTLLNNGMYKSQLTVHKEARSLLAFANL